MFALIEDTGKKVCTMEEYEAFVPPLEQFARLHEKMHKTLDTTLDLIVKNAATIGSAVE